LSDGGWHKLKTALGRRSLDGQEDELLDPLAMLTKAPRAVFIHPAWARQGIGRNILEACESAVASG